MGAAQRGERDTDARLWHPRINRVWMTRSCGAVLVRVVPLG
jgi:hypothetical protein